MQSTFFIAIMASIMMQVTFAEVISSDMCRDGMVSFGENVNGVDCVFCAKPENCEVSCVGTSVCFCGMEDAEYWRECCDQNPCCYGCPEENQPKSCWVSACRSDPPSCSETVCRMSEPERETDSGEILMYGSIQGESSRTKTKMCWELRNGKTHNFNKIILGECNGSDSQIFKLTPVSENGSQQSYMVHPKLVSDQKVVGVHSAKKYGWLRVEDLASPMDQTQIVTVFENNMVRIGNDPNVSEDLFLYITNQGATTEMGDPVMLSTADRLDRFEKKGDVIMNWDFVPSNELQRRLSWPK